MGDAEAIRVVLVDDHQMFTDSLARVLAQHPEVEVVGTGASGADAVRLVRQTAPDVLVLDYLLPDGTAPDLLPAIFSASAEVRVLVLSGRGDDRSMLAALDAGCAGFVTKTGAVDELLSAVAEVHRGEPYVPAARLTMLMAHIA